MGVRDLLFRAKGAECGERIAGEKFSIPSDSSGSNANREVCETCYMAYNRVVLIQQKERQLTRIRINIREEEGAKGF